jgi:4-hydroxy-2-oxoheptanedioate aldolase
MSLAKSSNKASCHSASGCALTRSVEIAKAMAVAGFDWLFLDMEHGVMSLEACAQISTAALDAGIAPIARVPNGEYAIATRALDNGALGIVMPHVDSAAEARKVVNRLKYPPVGHRSMGGIGPHYGLRSASSGEAAAALNAANLTIVMLETPTAIANAEEIAAVPGVDVLLIGTNDLCAEMGIHGDFGNERVADAYRTMIAAARKHCKFPGMAGVYNETIMPRYVEMGARFVLGGQDAAFMAAGYKTAFVLSHKLREAMGSQVHNPAQPELSGTVEIDGMYAGGNVKPANKKSDRVDRRLAEEQTGRRSVVVVAREILGRTLPFIVPRESDAVPLVR